MVTPPIQYFAAHATSGVVIPQGHAKTALESDPEERGRDMGVDARWVRNEPSSRTRSLTSFQMQTTVLRKGGVTENARHRLGLDHPRQEFLGRGFAVA